MGKRYWLVKSEPGVFSVSDLKVSENKTTFWDGVRNYQARNYLRDEMKIGDEVLFYHSNTVPAAVVGYCKIVKEGYPDHTAFEKESAHYDPKSDPHKPVWFMIDIKLIKEFKTAVTLEEIKGNPKLQNMKLVQRGNRLSVMPVSKEEFDEIVGKGTK
jgi:predicted RNA-binding protein with PUA-like domain